MNPAKIRVAIVLYLIGMVGIHAAMFWNLRQSILKGYPDFTIFYGAASIVRQGLGAELYNDALQFKVQREFAPGVSTRFSALPYNHPPFEALLFIPLTFFPYAVAYVLWAAVNFAILMATLHLLRSQLPNLQPFSLGLWVLAALAYLPVFISLLEGQDSILLLFLFTLAFVFLKTHRDFAAGSCLAFGLFKPQFVLPFLLLFVLQKRRTSVFGFSAVAAILAFASLVIVGLQGLISYPRYVFQLDRTGALGAIVPSAMPNLRGLFSVTFHNDSFYTTVLIASCAVLVVAIMYQREETEKTAFGLQFSLFVVATLLASYHCLEYDLSVLLIPVALLFSDLVDCHDYKKWPRFVIIASIALLFFSPLQLLLWLRSRAFALFALVILLMMVGIIGRFRSRREQANGF